MRSGSLTILGSWVDHLMVKYIGVAHGMNVPVVAAGAPNGSTPWGPGELTLRR